MTVITNRLQALEALRNGEILMHVMRGVAFRMEGETIICMYPNGFSADPELFGEHFQPSGSTYVAFHLLRECPVIPDWLQ